MEIIFFVKFGMFLGNEKSMSQNISLEKKIEDREKLPVKRASTLPDTRNELMKKMADFYESAENRFKHKTSEMLRRDVVSPDIIETVMTSISIMQERITRINLAVDRPDILIQPRLGELKMMNFDQVAHAISEGYIGVQEQLEDIRNLLVSP